MNAITTTNAMPAAVTVSVSGYVSAALAQKTRRAYRAAWQAFSAFCAAQHGDPLAATHETLAAFLAAQADAGLSAATVAQRIAGIRYALKLAGKDSDACIHPLVTTTLAGIQRTIGTAPKAKRPLIAEDVARMIETTDHASEVTEARNAAVITLGFASAMRRSELAALRVEDLEFCAEGLRITIRGSKTDQERRGEVIAVPVGSNMDVIGKLRHWMALGGIFEGALFRQVRKGGNVTREPLAANSIAQIIKEAAERTGIAAAEVGAHSLRSGFLTSAAMSGANLFKMMEVSRHKSVDMLRRYVRSAELFKEHAGAGFL